jgi:tRNA(fMet)-specific endonuclease VapC
MDRGSASGLALVQRLDRSDHDVAATIISAEEQLRGWLAQINRVRDTSKQIDAYGRLQRRIAFYASWHLLPWDTEAAAKFKQLRSQGIRIGSMDLKIASIVITKNAILLSRNLADFGQVPEMQVEDWL